MNTKEFQLLNINTMLKHLKMAMSYCNIYQDVTDLRYDPDKEVVICEYYSGLLTEPRKTWTLEINVACDSNSAMIKDVITRLDSFFG